MVTVAWSRFGTLRMRERKAFEISLEGEGGVEGEGWLPPFCLDPPSSQAAVLFHRLGILLLPYFSWETYREDSSVSVLLIP